MAIASDKFWQAEIIERRDFSDDLWAIRIKHEGEFKFQPGQYATFGVVEGDKVVERPYSIVSSPLEETMEFFLELVPQGELTPRLHKLPVGRIFNGHVGRQHIGKATNFPSPHGIGLARDRKRPHPRPANAASQQMTVDDGINLVGSHARLVYTLRPHSDGAFRICKIGRAHV